jgi:translation initiation factor 2 alpha subunit (eIF-2alpha)
MRNDVGNILGLVESDHYEAIPAETVEKLYELFGLLEQLFENRGKEGYEELLAKLPAEFHNNYHNLLQYAAQVNNVKINWV